MGCPKRRSRIHVYMHMPTPDAGRAGRRGGPVTLLSAVGDIAERPVLRKPTPVRGNSGLSIGNLNPMTVQAGNGGKPH